MIDREGEEPLRIFKRDDDVREGINSWMGIEACN
jgi:hypothetical protein